MKGRKLFLTALSMAIVWGICCVGQAISDITEKECEELAEFKKSYDDLKMPRSDWTMDYDQVFAKNPEFEQTEQHGQRVLVGQTREFGLDCYIRYVFTESELTEVTYDLLIPAEYPDPVLIWLKLIGRMDRFYTLTRVIFPHNKNSFIDWQLWWENADTTVSTFATRTSEPQKYAYSLMIGFSNREFHKNKGVYQNPNVRPKNMIVMPED